MRCDFGIFMMIARFGRGLLKWETRSSGSRCRRASMQIAVSSARYLERGRNTSHCKGLLAQFACIGELPYKSKRQTGGLRGGAFRCRARKNENAADYP